MSGEEIRYLARASKVSGKDNLHLIIPKDIREEHGITQGMEFEVKLKPLKGIVKELLRE